jgi:hypothetical protein
LLLVLTALSTPALATPTQEDVFRSIQDNVNDSGAGSGKVLALFAGAGALVILLVLLSQRRKRELTPRTLHHQGKLLKEVMRTTGLKPVELKQLKLLAEESKVGDEADAVQSPLTLLLCPSVLAKAVHARPPRGSGKGASKVDRKVVAQVVRKLGLHKTAPGSQ